MSSRKLKVQLFLNEFKEAANSDYGILYAGRSKNWDTLVELEITSAMRDEIVLGLSFRNYVSGPLKDEKGHSGELWVFGVLENSKEIYIKLKVLTGKAGKKAFCLSFHPAEHSLSFPLGRG
ncbi:MAG: toxin [Candidatus Sabulitectum sp.]|nr:toxin [Candidatus Sabulitectum sp.]